MHAFPGLTNSQCHRNVSKALMGALTVTALWKALAGFEGVALRSGREGRKYRRGEGKGRGISCIAVLPT